MKKNIGAILAILVVMFGFPWAAVTFAPGDAAMAICFVLFFGVNSMSSLYVGIYAGMAVKQRWYLPLVHSAAFLLGTWTVFEWGNPDFYGYATAYLAISVLTMLITIVVVRNVRKELKNNDDQWVF